MKFTSSICTLISIYYLSSFVLADATFTHWKVTENGFVQPKLDAPFELTNPNDLIAFLNQDTRWDNIISLYYELLNRKRSIYNQWKKLEEDTASEFSNLLTRGCLDSKPIDWYVTVINVGSERGITDYESVPPNHQYDNEVPDCKKISSLIFSLFAFEHLESLHNRVNLTIPPEETLHKRVSLLSLDELGSWVSKSLKQNSTSWFHYNLASVYWIDKGVAVKAIECSRRAVYYAPRIYKDIALFNLGVILFRSKNNEDALTVFQAALDHNEDYLTHFVLGNTYGVMGSLNESLYHYEMSVKQNSNFEPALVFKEQVKCYLDVFDQVEESLRPIKDIRSKLDEYKDRELIWLHTQRSFFKMTKYSTLFNYKSPERTCTKMSELTKLNMNELKREGEKVEFLKHLLDNEAFNLKHDEANRLLYVINNIERFIKNMEKYALLSMDLEEQINEELLMPLRMEIGPAQDYITLRKSIEMNEDYTNEEETTILPNSSSNEDDMPYTKTIKFHVKTSKSLEEFDQDPQWPSEEFCKSNQHLFPENLNVVYPVFMPLESKGISVSNILTEKIGVPAFVEHELPWYPPTCPQNKKFNQKQPLWYEVASSEPLRQKLLEYVGDGDADSVKHMQDAEIGHRIYAAMEMKVAPKWLLSILASLYWRVRDNKQNAMNCLTQAAKTVPESYTDIIVTSLSSLYLEMGNFDQALLTVEAVALVGNLPALNFLLYQLNMVIKRRDNQLVHLKHVIRLEPNYMNGLAKGILHAIACNTKDIENEVISELGQSPKCNDEAPVVTMVCEGRQCQMKTNSCAMKTAESDLENSGPNKEKIVIVDHKDVSFIKDLVNSLPKNYANRNIDKNSYNKLKNTLEKLLREKGQYGFSSILDSFDGNECRFQELARLYLLYLISLNQVIHETKDTGIQNEIISTQPTEKDIPDCQISSHDSIQFGQVLHIKVDGWDELPTIKQQISEVFGENDFYIIGAKIAAFLERFGASSYALAWAGWWCGAAGEGACALNCFIAASQHHADTIFTSLISLFIMQSKYKEAKEIAYMLFSLSPKGKVESFLVGLTHTYMSELEQAIWMYRYSLSLDETFEPSRAWMHATTCMLKYRDNN